MTDWAKIKAEYIEGGDSITTLARKHSVNPNTARYHLRNEHWSDLRRAARRKTDEILVETAADRRAAMAVLLDDAGRAALESIIGILKHHTDGSYTHITQQSETTLVMFDLLNLVEALAKLARVYGLDADSRLERKRLEQLQYPTGSDAAANIIIQTAPDRDLHEMLEEGR